jgi:thiamine biosynthesis lipoprotein ApbE
MSAGRFDVTLLPHVALWDGRFSKLRDSGSSPDGAKANRKFAEKSAKIAADLTT